MKLRAFLSLILACGLLLSGLAYSANPPAAATTPAPAAASAKTYQVTGPIVAVTDTMITVMKGKDKWELDRDANTKVTGDLKVGATVTIMYRMTAASVEVKEAKAAKTAKPTTKKP